MARGSTIAAVLMTLCLTAGLAVLATTVRDGSEIETENERLYLPDGRWLRLASLGYHHATADYTWLQATQYYGGYRQGEHDLRYFAGLVEAVTLLDPNFEEAYIFAALVHSMDHGDFDGAIDVLKEGLLHNADSWRLHFEVGFVHYVFRRDYTTAARWFSLAAALPGSSDFCRRFAAWSAGRGGDLRGSLALWVNLRQTTESADMQALADHMIETIEASLRGEPTPANLGGAS